MRFSKDVRYLSCLVLIVFIIGTLASLSLLPTFALSPFDDEAYLLEDADRINLYLDAENVFESKEDKLATMELRIASGDYELYADSTTGEVAIRNTKTGQILSTNPYDVASAPDAVKAQLMNQISLKYCAIKDGVEKTFGSFTDAALREQITVKNIKNGVRVEYTLGREATKQLYPGWIEYNRFQELIAPARENCYTEADIDAYIAAQDRTFTPEQRLAQLEKNRETRYNRTIMSNYTLINPNDPGNSAAYNKQIAKDYPCTAKTGPSDYDGDGTLDKMAIYAVIPGLSERVKNSIESAIKQWTNYTYEDLQEDTSMTGYPGEDSNPALFRLALEYTIGEKGLDVRLPANSIRYDEDTYRLNSIDMLPYFGTTSNDFTGYTFIPDGSGTIIRNEEIMNAGSKEWSTFGQIYGPDYAYHNITNYYNGKNQIMHIPVFGTVEDTVMKTWNLENQTGYVWLQTKVLNQETGKQEYFTSTDRIMIDALNSAGKVITTAEEFLAQFKVNDAGVVIREGHADWENGDYKEIEIGPVDDPLKNYNVYAEANATPYAEAVIFFLMAPALDEEGKVITYKGDTVYVYVDAEGNPIDVIVKEVKGEDGELKLEFYKKDGTKYESDPRVSGVIKVKEQLWYNGAPAYYDSDVPMNPVEQAPDTGDDTTDDGTTGDGTTEDGTTEGDTTEGDTTEGDTTEGGTTEGGTTEGGTTEGDTTEEPEEVIEYYNNIPKVTEKYDEPAYEEIESQVSQGYVAVITEGDALSMIYTLNGGRNPETDAGGTHKYNSAYIKVFPRPQDSYRLADAISVSNDATVWTVVSDRKYTGSYRVSYIMISDATYIDETTSQIKNYEYEASYVGMANAYRDYLIENGVLTPLENVDDDIPLYLEAFGMSTTTKVVATIPVVADVSLTSFEDVKTIYTQLSGEGIDNVNFRLTGFSKGGLYSYAPSSMKFESVVGGNRGYEELIEYAKEVSSASDKNLGIFPDFDFANVERVGGADGFDSLKDSARTIDDRYATKREYDYTYQSFSPVGSITVSPSVYMKLYESFAKKIDKYGVFGLSVASLGTDLNSDFDTDDAYNREDSKYYTVQLLQTLSEKYGNVMIDGGNAYALAYADYILNMPLDSSRFARANNAIPFMGMVLHGYVNYAGTVTGMASDINREMLKIIENGAAPYFTIAYENTDILKEDMSYSDYYSVDYTICYDTIVETYNTINKVLADVQTATISDHQFLTGIRDLSEKELAEVAALMAIAASEEGYTAAKAEALKAYNNRKALAERHGEEFTEVFSETYPYFASDYTSEEDTKLYQQFVYDEYCATFDRTVEGSNIVLVEYTRKDGTTKTFVLNYGTYGVTVEVNGAEVTVASLGFAVVGE